MSIDTPPFDEEPGQSNKPKKKEAIEIESSGTLGALFPKLARVFDHLGISEIDLQKSFKEKAQRAMSYGTNKLWIKDLLLSEYRNFNITASSDSGEITAATKATFECTFNATGKNYVKRCTLLLVPIKRNGEDVVFPNWLFGTPLSDHIVKGLGKLPG